MMVKNDWCRNLWPFLLTWFNFYLIMGKKSHAQESVGWNYYFLSQTSLVAPLKLEKE